MQCADHMSAVPLESEKKDFEYGGESAVLDFVDPLAGLVNPSLINSMRLTLIEDETKVRKMLYGLANDDRNVNGLSTKTIKIFIEPITNEKVFVEKVVNKTSKLNCSGRGFRIGGTLGFRVKDGVVGARSKSQLKGKADSISYWNDIQPMTNLLMLKCFLRAFDEASPYGNPCDFIVEPMLVLDSRGKMSQVMEYVDTSTQMSQGTLPKKDNATRNLTIKLCEAACMANVTLQGDCVQGNFGFVRNSFGEICGIRMFDCNIMDSGSEEDLHHLLDFTNLASFDYEEAMFQKFICTLGCPDARAAMPPLISRAMYDALVNSLDALRKIAAEFTPNATDEVPFMLSEGGLLEQWLSRVMVVGTDGRLYRNATSEISTEFDDAAAMFVLHKVGCIKGKMGSLFVDLNFIDLEERYQQSCTVERESELMAFFGPLLDGKNVSA
jgi:hypothetical protein